MQKNGVNYIVQIYIFYSWWLLSVFYRWIRSHFSIYVIATGKTIDTKYINESIRRCMCTVSYVCFVYSWGKLSLVKFFQRQDNLVGTRDPGGSHMVCSFFFSFATSISISRTWLLFQPTLSFSYQPLKFLRDQLKNVWFEQLR